MNEAIQMLYAELQGVFGLAVLGVVILEWVFLTIARKIRSHKEGMVNILSYALDSIPYIFLGRIVIFGAMLWAYEHRFFTLGYDWYVWIIAYLLYDFMFYVVHFIGHKVRFFWCIHGVHHTLEEMKLTAAVRGSFIGFIYMPHTIIWLPLLGFDPFVLLIVESIARLYGLYAHISEDVVGRHPALEKIFITPSVHRVHHAKNPLYVDKNYGETFSIWDKLFGTFQTQIDSEKPVYGLKGHDIDSESLWQIQTLLWRKLWRDMRETPRLSDKLKYIVMPPGWCPGGEDMLPQSANQDA